MTRTRREETRTTVPASLVKEFYAGLGAFAVLAALVLAAIALQETELRVMAALGLIPVVLFLLVVWARVRAWRRNKDSDMDLPPREQ